MLKPQDKINKAAWSLVEELKAVVSLNIAIAARQSQIDVKGESLQKLLSIVNASIEEGYTRNSRTFSKTVDAVLAEEALPELQAHSSKKKSG